MSASVVFLAPAREELSVAADWYDEQRPGLGVEFVVEIGEAVAQIRDNPEGWPRWREDRPYRKRFLTRFPYVLFYVVAAEGHVEVVAVAHARRKPGYWLERQP